MLSREMTESLLGVNVVDGDPDLGSLFASHDHITGQRVKEYVTIFITDSEGHGITSKGVTIYLSGK